MVDAVLSSPDFSRGGKFRPDPADNARPSVELCLGGEASTDNGTCQISGSSRLVRHFGTPADPLRTPLNARKCEYIYIYIYTIQFHTYTQTQIEVWFTTRRWHWD